MFNCVCWVTGVSYVHLQSEGRIQSCHPRHERDFVAWLSCLLLFLCHLCLCVRYNFCSRVLFPVNLLMLGWLELAYSIEPQLHLTMWENNGEPYQTFQNFYPLINNNINQDGMIRFICIILKAIMLTCIPFPVFNYYEWFQLFTCLQFWLF